VRVLAYTALPSRLLSKLVSTLIVTVVRKSVSSVNCGLRVSTQQHVRTVFLQQIHQRPEKASVEIDRKILADIAVFDKLAFTALVEKAKAALA
jgi:hypothetical protein